MFKVIQIRLENDMNRKMQELDLTSAQGHIIGFLAHSEQPPCARDLEKHFGLSHPTVSGLLRRMEAKGFVQIRPDETDGRVKRIFLMEKGIACSRTIHQSIQKNEQLLLDGFGPEEAELLHRMLIRVIGNLGVEPEITNAKREEL